MLIFFLKDLFLMVLGKCRLGFRHLLNPFWKKRENMRSIKRASLSVALFLCGVFCGQSAFASNAKEITLETTHKQEIDNTMTYVKSPMTLVSTDFSFGLLDEPEANRLVGRLRARPISLRR